MTSPDSAGLPDPGSGWEGLGIPDLGEFFLEQMVVRPLAQFLASVTGRTPGEYEDLIGAIAEKNSIVSAILDWVLGLLGIGAVRDEIAAFAESLADAVAGTPLVGGPLAAFINGVADFVRATDDTATSAQATANTAISSANAAQAQIVTVQQIFAVRSSRPLWEGIDPTGESTFPFVLLAEAQLHGHTLGGNTNTTGAHVGHSGVSGMAGDHQHTLSSGTISQSGFSYVSATSALVPGGCIRCESATEKKQITLQAFKTGSVTAFFLDVYKMNEDGSWALLHSTASKHGDLLTVLTWLQFAITPQLSELGDVFGIQFRVGGTGSVSIAGVELPVPTALPGFRPNQIGFIRTTNTAPSTISTAEMDAAYSAYTPYIQIGSDVGQLNAPRNFYDNANRSVVGPNWAQFSTTSSQFVITSNQFAYNGSTDGWQAGLYVLPLATDTVSVEWDVTAATAQKASGILCSNSGLTNYATVDVDSGGSALYSATSISAGTSRATSGTGGNGRYKLEYTLSTNTFKWYKFVSGAWSQLGSWIDSGNVITHGSGERFFGHKFNRSFFTNGSPIDNVNGYDVAV